jgi:hypothetical protein
MSTDDSCGNRLTDFFHREMGGDTLGNADAVAYTAPSGAVVFAAGSTWFVWGLADGSSLSGLGQGLVDPRLQRFVTNMFDDLSTPRSADLGVTLTQASADTTPAGTVKIDATLTNGGPDSVRRAVLDISLPADVRFVRVASTGLTCTTFPLQCTIDQFTANTSIEAMFTLRPRTRHVPAITAKILAPTDSDPNTSSVSARLVLQHTPRGNGPTAAYT